MIQHQISILITAEPFLDQGTINRFLAVTEIIGDHNISKLIHLLAVFCQFITIYCRIYIAAIHIKIYQRSSCRNCIGNVFLQFFFVDLCSFYFRYDLKSVIILLYVCIVRFLIVLHTVQTIDDLLKFVLIISNR